MPALRPAALLTALALAGVLALTGCAPGGGPAEEPIPTEPDGGEGDGLTTEIGGPCLIGDWTIDESEMRSFYEAVGEASGMEIGVTGSTRLEIDESSYQWLPVYTISFPAGGSEVSGDVSGSIRGDYTVAEGVITTVNDVSDIEAEVTVGGIPFDASGIIEGILSDHPINSASYHCEEGAPVIDFPIPGGTHPVRLVER